MKVRNFPCYEIHEKNLEKPELLLIDVDGFSYINDFYGTEAGNLILTEFISRLNSLVPKYLNSNIYKLEGDHFGILFEHNPGYDPAHLAIMIIEEMEMNDLIYRDLIISFSVSIGISRERPVLETANMALNYVKRCTRLKYLEYCTDLLLH